MKISRSTVGMYESGAREPDYETLESIADIFNVDIDYLLVRTTIKRKVLFDEFGDEYINIQSPTTLAAHFDGDEYTEDELEEIKKFAQFVKSKRESKG